MSSPPKIDIKKSNPIIVGIILLVLFLLYNSYVIVESGQVGVVRRLKAVQPIVLTEGFHFIAPFVNDVVSIDIRLQSQTAKSRAASKDLQNVSTTVTLAYSLESDSSPTLFQKVGNRAALNISVITPAVQESVKAITAKYTAAQLITQRSDVKDKIQLAIEQFIQKTLSQKDKSLSNAISVANVAITAFEFSEKFNQAIEDKVKAEQEAEQAKNEKERKITQAEASNQEKKLDADAVAYETNVISKARADAIRREAAALRSNPSLIQLKATEKWDGKLPQFTGSNAIPFINMSLGKTK